MESVTVNYIRQLQLTIRCNNEQPLYFNQYNCYLHAFTLRLPSTACTATLGQAVSPVYIRCIAHRHRQSVITAWCSVNNWAWGAARNSCSNCAWGAARHYSSIDIIIVVANWTINEKEEILVHYFIHCMQDFNSRQFVQCCYYSNIHTKKM